MQSGAYPTPIIIDRDLIECSLTLEPFRYPIATSDGRRYELGALLNAVKEQGLISPTDRTPLTWIKFDFLLESSLDKNPTLERYKYDDRELYPNGYNEDRKKADIAELHRLIEEAKYATTISTKKSLMLGGAVGAATLILYVNSMTVTKVSLAPHLAVATSLVDYSVRYLTNHRFGLFSGSVHAVKTLAEAYHEYFQHQLDEIASAFSSNNTESRMNRP